MPTLLMLVGLSLIVLALLSLPPQFTLLAVLIVGCMIWGAGLVLANLPRKPSE